jgi:hypothetical protein
MAPRPPKVQNMRIQFVHHQHKLPACTPTKHDLSCRQFGWELSCTVITISSKPTVQICNCNHIPKR